MRHGSLFSGIGGFDLAAEQIGWENIFHCEWSDFPKKILKYYWPKAISYDDITKTDFSIHRGTIDILTGGFPCQPYSVAGKRKGKEDERHLWPEMLRAIREIQPRWVVGENVGGLVSWDGGLVFEEVQADLEAEGYQVQAFILPACAVNAPHRRDRIWFVAYAGCNSSLRKSGEHGCPEGKEWLQEWHKIQQPSFSNTLREFTSDTSSFRSNEGRSNSERKKENKTERPNLQLESERLSEERFTSDTNSLGLWGEIDRVRKSKQFNKNSKTGNWENFPTQPPLCNGDDGLSARLDGITFSKWRQESIKGGGNAIVPQVALQIFKAIEVLNNQ